MRRRWYDHGGPDLPDRPVSLVKDEATKLFGGWTTNWADSGWVRPEPGGSPGGEGPAAPPGPTADRTPDTIAVPVDGEYLVIKGKVYAVHENGAYVQIKASWRQRWAVTTDAEAINA